MKLISWILSLLRQGRIQDLIGGGGGPDRDRPKTAFLGPQFCRILVLGPHFWWSGGGPGPRPPPLDPPLSENTVKDFDIGDVLQELETENSNLAVLTPSQTHE